MDELYPFSHNPKNTHQRTALCISPKMPHSPCLTATLLVAAAFVHSLAVDCGCEGDDYFQFNRVFFEQTDTSCTGPAAISSQTFTYNKDSNNCDVNYHCSCQENFDYYLGLNGYPLDSQLGDCLVSPAGRNLYTQIPTCIERHFGTTTRATPKPITKANPITEDTDVDADYDCGCTGSDWLKITTTSYPAGANCQGERSPPVTFNGITLKDNPQTLRYTTGSSCKADFKCSCAVWGEWASSTHPGFVQGECYDDMMATCESSKLIDVSDSAAAAIGVGATLGCIAIVAGVVVGVVVIVKRKQTESSTKSSTYPKSPSEI